MPTSSTPRVVRKNKPKKKFNLSNYRSALPLLLEDFENRCAYSLMHVKMVSERGMHVDHFNPKHKNRSPYTNLFPAYGICNQAKWESWPTAKQRRLGMRYLNPCEERDYDNVIFEDPTTHLLVGTTPAARYHIDMLDLNNPSLVEHRRERTILAEIAEKMVGAKSKAITDVGGALEIVRQIRMVLETKIPPIKRLAA
ncbi:MAG: hypothetical protein ACREFX_10245 [Opitutaceae bacterium]